MEGDNKKILQSGGTSEPKIESASNVDYMDNLYKDIGIASFSDSDNSAYTKFTEKGTNLQNYNFPDINEKNPLSSYTEYGVNVGAGKNYNLQRAKNQTWKDNALNVAAGFIPKVAFGTVGLAGHLGGLLFDQDGDYENALTSWAKESEEYFTSDNKNYAENPNASFFSGEYWSDPSNYWDMVDGVVTSAITFALPGAGVASATSKMALGISRALGASAKATKIAMGIGTTASSLTMGYAEAAMSGADIYKEQLEKNLAKGMSYDDAKRIASGAAHTTVALATTFNTILNLPILGSFTQKTDDILRKEVGDIVDNMNLRSVDKDGNVVDAVTGKRIDTSKDLGGVKQMPDEIKNLPKINEVSNLKAAADRISDIKYAPTKWDVAKQYGKEAVLESLEEGQIALAEEAGRKYTDPDGKGQDILKTLKDAFGGINKSEFWESAVLGALGGVGMKGLIENRPSNREVQEIDPNITFDPATQTYKTPEGKEVKDNLKRDANGNIIKKRMRAASHDNEQKRQMIASEVAYMAEDLATTDYWQNQIQTITQDFKANNKVVDYTEENGTVSKRVMTEAEAKSKLENAKDQLFNLSARRSIMSGRGDNFKVIFQNILNTSNEDSKILDAKATQEIDSLKDVITKQNVIATDDNVAPEQKEAAQEVIEKAKSRIAELSNNLGKSSAELQGFSTGANDNDYQERAKEAIKQIDVYTKEYNKLKEAYDYGTVESRQALSHLLQNRMQRHAWTYKLERERKALMNKFNEITDSKSKNDYLGWFNHLANASKREIAILEAELNKLADDKVGEQEHADELKQELDKYINTQLNNDYAEIIKNPTKREKYQKEHAKWLAEKIEQRDKLAKTIQDKSAEITQAEEDAKSKTGDDLEKVNKNIEKAKEDLQKDNQVLQILNQQIDNFTNFDKFVIGKLQIDKVNEYKKSLINEKLDLLRAKNAEYDNSIEKVNDAIANLKEELKKDTQDPVKINEYKTELIELLKSAQFGFLDLPSLGLAPEKINGYDYPKLRAMLEHNSKQFAQAVKEVFNSPELQRLNERMSLGLEQLDKDFDDMTTKGGHDKLIENAGIIHKRQVKLYLDYINDVRGVYDRTEQPISNTQSSTTPEPKAPEKKNKFGITESKYAEYVNLKTIQQSYEQGIESANLNIVEAKLNIANANGDNKVIIQNEQLIVDSQNKIDTYSKQLSEINKSIASVLKDSPFEKINNEANQLKSLITKQYYDDIDKAAKENDSQRSLIWNNLFEVYAKFIQAIDAFKEASLNNIQTFEDNVRATNDTQYQQFLAAAQAEFNQNKTQIDFEFKKLDNSLTQDELEAIIQQEQQVLLNSKINDVKTRIEALNKAIAQSSKKKQPTTALNLRKRLQSELEGILKKLELSTEPDLFNDRISDIETQAEVLNNLVEGSKLINYLNSDKPTLFLNDSELINFFNNIGITFDDNITSFLSGAFKSTDAKVQISYDDENETRGSFDSIENTIDLNAAYLQTPERAKEVVMHELVHAITRQRFMNDTDNIISKTNEVLDKWLSILGKDSGELTVVEKLEEIRLSINGSDSVNKTFNNIISAIKDGGESRLDELYAEAFSNKEFAQLLKSQVIEGSYDINGGKTNVKTSIWNSFLSIILEGVAKIGRAISKTKQISILNELALILNNNPSLTKTPKEKTKIDAETKQEFDDKIVEKPIEVLPTIDLTEKTHVVIPAIKDIAPPELTTGELQNNLGIAPSLLEDTIKAGENIPDVNTETPDEEEQEQLIIDFDNGQAVTPETIIDNADYEEKIDNLTNEALSLIDEIKTESEKLIDELLQEEGAIEVIQSELPSGAIIETQIINPDTQEAVNQVSNNTEQTIKDVENNTAKEAEKLEKEKAKKDKLPKAIKEGKPKKAETPKVDSVAEVKPDSELAEKIGNDVVDKPVVVQDNGNGTSNILPAETNSLSGVSHAIPDAKPLIQNVPNSIINTDTKPVDSKAPEQEVDNAPKAVIEKRGVPKNNKALRDDLQKRPDIPQEGKEFAVTKEPNNSRALRLMNANGTLGNIVFDNLTDEQAEAYKDSMTNELKSNSGFYTNERISNATTEVVSDNYSENKGYMPALYGDNVEFEKWYKQAVKILHETGDADKIDFSNTPVRDNLVNQRRIKNTFQEPSYNMDLARLLYTNAKQILLDKYNKMNNSDISADIINNENMTIHIEKPLSVLDMGWSKEEENNTFVQVFDSIEDFIAKTQFIAIGQGKIDALLFDKKTSASIITKKTEVIGITTPLVENNSVKVYLQDLNSTIVGNFQNPNRFTHIKFEKQEDGKFKVSLTFLNTDKSFEEAAKNEELFTFDELIDSDDFIAYNSSARLLMNNFVTGLGDKETVVLRTPEEKSNYLAEANLTLSLKEKSSNKLSDNEVKSIFAKDSTGKVKFYQRAKGIDDKMIGITENELPKIYEDGRYVFLEIKHGKLLPLKVNPKSLEDFNTEQIKNITKNQLLLDTEDIQILNKRLGNFIHSNFYIAHKLGDKKIKPRYSIEEVTQGKYAGQLKLSFYLAYEDAKPINLAEAYFHKDAADKIVNYLNSNIKNHFNSAIAKLNEIYPSSDSKKNFNNRSVIMVTNGLVALGEDVTPYLDVKYDHDDRFGNVSFAYKGNDDFKKPTEVERTYEDVEVVVDDNTNKTPEKEMEIDEAHASIPSGSVGSAVEQLSKRITTYRSKIKSQERLDSTVNNTYNDIFKGKSNFDLRYPNISKVISDSNITNETTVGTLFYSSLNPFLKKIKPLDRFREYFTLNESNEKQTNINSLLNELYDLTIRLMEYSPNSEPNVNVDENDISKTKEDKEC